MLRRDEQRRYRTLANAQIITQGNATIVWPGHRKSQADALNFSDSFTHLAKHIVVLICDVRAVGCEQRGLLGPASPQYPCYLSGFSPGDQCQFAVPQEPASITDINRPTCFAFSTTLQPIQMHR